jgi:sugar (pentulose or hexulose) kinase
MTDLVIGIDSSTSATKAIAWDAGGRAVAEGRAPVALDNPRPGFFEQDPRAWWSSTVAALNQLLGVVEAGRVAAIAISNQRETFALFAADGTPLRPGTLWLDERARPQQRRFGERFGAERLHRIGGKPLDITPCLFRFLWHAEHEPALFSRAAMYADVNATIAFHLVGDWVTPTASADPMGMLDMVKLCWSSEILDAAGIDEAKLPRLVRPGAAMGELTQAAAAATGLKAGTLVVAGGGDGQCAGAGTGMVAPGAAYLNLGTAVVSGSYGRSYVYDPAFRTEVAVADEGYIFETCLRAGTFLVDWFARELLGSESRQPELTRRLEEEAAASPIGAGGVALVPYWQGCMDPYWDSAARGIVAGLSGSTRRGDIYRALLEGIALELAAACERVVAATGVPIDQLVAVGGGAASDLWAQIIADTGGRPVVRSATVEASSLGAAMAAAKGAGWFPTIAAASAAMAGKAESRVTPDPARAARYAELKSIHAELWPLLSGWNRRLAAFAGE